ncbi:SDR family NAD(P)-dependent oxidoreductase [Streptomyces sp. 205]|uniref:SDR family NAD(P)-dependent oxidoreductase n=1 Tax=Streptomyces coffeae TaxID=621382 RepID=A0ABS1NRH3_9ACTN|nr:type I polyketide synthase [Streptomyces coffeae]MBL1102487.1 SDR family NAD(P)-dependent oxidoreductase [Streptomyces coffeae]
MSGKAVDWHALFTGSGARRVELPTYAFERQRYWPEAPQAAVARTATPEAAVEAEFWAAVDGADLESLAARLGVGIDALDGVVSALSSWRSRHRTRSTVDSWRFRETWRTLNAVSQPASLTGTWLVVVPAHEAEQEWVRVVVSTLGSDAVPIMVADADRTGLAGQLTAQLVASGTGSAEIAGVVSLLAADERSGDARVPAGAVNTAVLVQALEDAGIGARVWAVTRGAVSTGSADPVTNPMQAAVWGLGRVAALECSERWGGLIDLPQEAEELDDHVARWLIGVLGGSGGGEEDQVAIRASGVFGRRLIPAPAAESAVGEVPETSDAADGEAHGAVVSEGPDAPDASSTEDQAGWDLSGTVLITGGTGALGAHVARWLAARGARHLLLLSRRGPQAPGAAELEAELTTLGARATIAACDVADRDDLERVLAAVPTDFPLTGVVHSAGVVDDAALDNLTPEYFEEVFRSKVAPALLLDELTRDRDLSVFALFSSVAGAVGNPGQANYAAANAVLDALARQRRSRGLVATSIAWGAWSGDGMAARVRLRHVGATGSQQLEPTSSGAGETGAVGTMGSAGVTGPYGAIASESQGQLEPHRQAESPRTTESRATSESHRTLESQHSLEPALALEALSELVAEPDPTTVVADLANKHLLESLLTLRHIPSLTTLPGAREAAETAREARRQSETAASALRERIQAVASENERLTVLLDLVRTHAAVVLGHPGPDAIKPDRAFQDHGFDSLTAVELRKRLGMATGLTLPSTMVFDYPTPLLLAGHLRAELLEETPAAPGPVAAPVPADDEPIAIIGMSCRFPGGASSPEKFWDLISSGGDAISEFPVNRGWDTTALYDPDPDRSGTTYSTQGGFLHDAGDFDPVFFGISPREALVMDPQQRLLLETAWEAIERAGIDPSTLRSSLTGAFIGSSYQEYGRGAGDGTEGHMVTGSSPSVLSGRVSYVLGLEGPAVTVDTACSSSLVALHLACQSLRNGESSLALAGGATVMTTPDSFVAFSRQRALAADGRCKAFADGADGMTLAEGVGLLLVERLSDARRNGHPVLAVIRGSAINQDGASNGLTAPNGPSQQRVIRQALASARISPAAIDAVEAHGTGTALGDPIEAQALLATYGRDRDPERPVWLGSVKSNIGHAQSAAGVASVIKMVMALRQGVLPQTLHADVASTHVDWSSGALRLVNGPMPWPESGQPRRCAVSSFGISGTNAHVVLEQAPEAVESGEGEVAGTAGSAGMAGSGLGVVPWVVSGRSVGALRDRAAGLVSWLGDGSAVDAVDVGYSLVASRSVFEHRGVVVGAGCGELMSGLEELGGGGLSGSVVRGVADVEGRTVFVFPGQGAQWVGMGAGLLESSSVFAERFAECGEALGRFVDWSVEDVVRGVDGAASLERVDVVQPVSFAVMVGLAAVWESFGVVPDAVVGHSQGEIAAAVVSGALSVEDGARVVALRSGVIGRRLAGRGGMVSVGLSVGEVRSRLVGWGEGLSVAAVNGPRSVVVCGEAGVLEGFVVGLVEEGVRVRRIAVDYASHSVQVEGVREELLGVLGSVVPRVGRVPLLSSVSGEWLDGGGLDAGYWYRNLREEVRFASVVGRLLEEGYRAFVEVSAHPVLSVGVQDVVDEVGVPAVCVGTLRRGEGGWDRVLRSVGEAFVRGVAVDWGVAFGSARRVDLPTYPFQHERFWVPPVGPEREQHATDPVDAEFWTAVEEADVSTLTESLDVDEEALAAILPGLTAWRRRRHEQTTVDDWQYRIRWTPTATLPPATLSGTWLVVTAEDGGATEPSDASASASASVDAGADVVSALQAHGARVRRVTLDASCVDRTVLASRLAATDERDNENSEEHADHHTEAHTTADHANHPDHVTTPEPEPIAGIVSLLAAAEEPCPEYPGLVLGTALTVALVQALEDSGTEAPLWCLTRGAVSTGRSDQVTRPVQAQTLGIGWTTALEHPRLWGGVVDLPENLDERAGQRLAAVLAGSTQEGTTQEGTTQEEDQLAIRTSGVLVRRIVRAVDREPRRSWEPRGTALVTGGTGTLGPHVARWLANQGAKRIVLVSRRGMDAPDAAELVDELAQQDTDVTVAACDITDRAALAALLDRLAAEGHSLRTVIHAAATIELHSLAETDMAAFARVLHAKVVGARNLDELLAETELDSFVLFSSVAGMWGSGRHAAYVAGNAYLSALAENRRARGLTATSVHWGIWANELGSGRVAPDEVRRTGLEFMDANIALTGMRRAMDADATVLAIANVDWERYYPVFSSVRSTRLFDEVPEVRRLIEAAEQQVGRAGEGEFAAGLAAVPPVEQVRMLLEAVRGQAAAVLGHSSVETVGERRAFRELGFDSLTAVDLRNRLVELTGRRLPATLVFDHPTPMALAEFLRAEITGDQPLTAGTYVAVTTAATDEPIAIVGMSCRYPGEVNSPEELWELVMGGVDAISGFPADRGWPTDALYDPDPDTPGRTYAVQGGFLHSAPDFDPAFFGISPREALVMDPQQRLLLETAWEAFERAGIIPDTVRSSPTGVFIGASYQDYQPSGPDGDGTGGHAVTGSLSSVLSGRVAYLLGLEGPAVTVDTACSSSLMALHLACQSVRNGESTLALAGGVSVMSTANTFIGFSSQRALAPDGRCKAYGDSADGMALAEGVGMVLVERLSDARRNGHPILAVIRGSAVNQDGASNGLTAPNGPSQQRVIRQALANASLAASDIDAVEGHGTGTALGDPIEAQALLATYGQDRELPLLLGSVKSNIGHTQAASGVASVIKMVMALRHGVLPPTLHADTPSSHVDWSAGAVRLLTEPTPWPEVARPHRAGVSSFGISGTNVHTVLEQAPMVEASAEPAAERDAEIVPVVLSGRSDDALRAQADRLLSLLADGSAHLTDLAYSQALTRSGFERRAAVIAHDHGELLRGLEAVRDGASDAKVVRGGIAGTGTSGTGGGRLAFLFSGQGGQRPGMGRELYGRYPVFADALDAVLAHLDTALDRPLREVMFAEESTREAALLDRTEYTQPALFAVEVALFRLLESWGVEPDVLTGHSVGEIAAAHVGGVLALEDACRLVAARGRLMAQLPEGGAMTAVQAAEDEVVPLLTDQVSIAAVNGPASLVIAGDADAVERIAAVLAERGRRIKSLRVSHAFHSPRMDTMLSDFAQVAAGLTYHRPELPVVSTVTGEPVSDEELCSPDYWVRHVRRTVRFADAVATLAERGVRTFLELGPDGALSAMVRECLEDDARAAAIPMLRRDRAEVPTVTAALAGVHVRGVTVDWTGFFAGMGAHRIELPTYAFQRQRYWPEPTLRASADGDGAEAGFWSAVEREDIDSLAATLDLDAEAVSALAPALSSWRRRRRDRSAVDALRYQVTWKPAAPAPTHSALSGRWLLLTPAGAENDAWVAELADGLGVPTVRLGVGAADRASLAERLRGERDHAFAGVLSLLALRGDEPHGVDEPHGADEIETGAASALTATVFQALGDAGIDAPLWCLTRGAVSIGRSEPVRHPEQAAVWGLGRVVALEHPTRWGGLIDLPERIDPSSARRLRAVLAGTGANGEDQVAVRASGVFVRRLAHNPVTTDRTGPAFTPSGTVLVTGGTGGLGGHIARWLARAGAEHLLLVSRRGEDAPGAEELRRELTGHGVRVTLAACDAADRDALAAVLAGIPDACPLTAVIHTAGVIEDRVVDDLTPDDFTAVFRAKAVSARNLDELTAGMDLSAFVLFSSTAGVIGAAGQGNYAAANAYLDALAEHRRARGHRAASLAWGPWAGSGMVGGDDGEIERRVRRGGFAPLTPDLALAALRAAVEHDDTALTVADIDWRRFVSTRTSARSTAFVGDLPEVRETIPADAPALRGEPELRQRLADMPGAERGRFLLELLRAQVAGVLGHTDVTGVAPDWTFRDLGFDSLTTLELRNGLATATGLTLPASLLYDYPTPEELADFLLTELLGRLPESGAPATVPTGPVEPDHRHLADDPIAIVGIGCRFPGGVSSPEEFWQLLAEGRDAISAFPTDRTWDLDALAAGASTTREGGFLSGVADFDAGFFGISPREALAMDPQQRLLLETSWEALERSGIAPAALRGSRTGVFVGTNGQDYTTLLRRGSQDVQGYAATGNTASVLSGRVSYVLGLEGPAVTVDTACSASLVALHWATRALRDGECSLALAGGVSVMSSPDAFVEFSAQGGLAPDGRCKAFSRDADGTSWSEGVGILVLERLSDAVRNGHEVHGIVRGTAVNQDGASNGLTAPNGPSQQRVIRQALADAGLAHTDIDALDAHGTGTVLGDPIEAEALMATYGQDRERPLLLGTVKSNLGHTQAAAGIAGVIKMVLSMRQGVLPRTLHADPPTPHLAWDSSGLSLLTEPADWPEIGRPRRAGVSAFGVSGTNAHVIVEQAPAAPPEPVEAGRTVPAVVPWVVSGRTPEALQAQLDRLTSFTRQHPGLPALDVACSLATARSAFAHRAVLLATDDSVTEIERGVVRGTRRPVAFLFSGQGSQRLGMGRELYERYPAFADALDAVLAHLDTELDRPLREVMWGEDTEELNRTGCTQPALFAVEVALFRLMESWGVTADCLAGHSIGEVAAAHAAGVLSLKDACRLVAARARLMDALPEGGAMVAVQATEDEVLSLMNGPVSVAAVNGPDSVVVSGDADRVLAIAAHFTEQGRRTTRLSVSHAFHSPLMDPMLTAFRQVVEQLEFHEPRVTVVSNLTGAPATAEELCSPEYWVRHVRETVRFADGVRALNDEGVGVYVELGPDGVLSAAARQLLDGPLVVPVLRRDHDEDTALVTALSRLHVGGVGIDWRAYFAGTGARPVALPTYAFQRERYWPEPAPVTPADPVEAEFWTAVEQEDWESLAGTLGLDGDPASAMTPALSALTALSSWRRRRREQSASDDWQYRTTWVPVAVPGHADGSDSASVRDSAAAQGRWLVLAAPSDPWLSATRRALGGHVVCTEMTGDGHALREPLEGGGEAADFSGVVALPTASAGALELLEELGEAGVTAPLWCVTRGAVKAAEDDRIENPEQAAVWGTGRVAALEWPERWGGLIDLAEEPDARFAALLRNACAGHGPLPAPALRPHSVPDGSPAPPAASEDELAVRPSGVVARRLVRAVPSAESWTPAGTVLVVGTGPMGARVARWLVREGAESLVVIGHDTSDAAGLEDELGAAATVLECDTADRDALAALLDAIPADTLTAVVHAEEPRGDTLSEAIAGVRNLDVLLADRPLDAFVLFSSIAGVWGVRGRGTEAAAGAVLEALAERRRDRGLAALALAWGAWADVTGASLAAHLRMSGLPVLDPRAALTALGRAVAGGEASLTVADVDWDTFAPAFTASRDRALLAELPEARTALATATRDRETAESAAVGIRERLLALPESERHGELLALVREKSALVLGHTDTDAVDADRPFRDLGFDSLAAVDLRDQLTRATGLSLPATAVFDFPTPLELADHLVAAALGVRPAPAGPAEPVGHATDEPLAIVGMSCRFPGGVRSPEDLWDLVMAGTDAIGEMPVDRGWDFDALLNGGRGGSVTRSGGFLYDAADFDPGFFGISPHEALVMDPQQRLVLESAWEALERAGIDPAVLRGTDAGAFVGGGSGDYRLPDDLGRWETAQSASLLSGRLAYTFGLQGPTVSVDTACSSSLVALHLAAQALRSGECSVALTGGVTVMSTPVGFVEFSAQGALSPDGRCKAFSDAADGTGWAEGVGMLVVERLSDARRNGHPVLAVLRGSAINQDGASNGLTAPNGPSQQRVIQRALAAARLSPADVDAVEAHGTGTSLGDPIEAQALLATYGQERERPLLLGSVKSNIGHTQAASGAAGVIKMVMALRHGVIPPTLHADTPSSRVDWSAGAVQLLTEAAEWPDSGRPRRAGVSSFGASGTNAHVILEQVPPVAYDAVPAGDIATAVPADDRTVPVLLSARTPDALRSQASRLLAHADACPTLGLTDLAYSLATSRSLFEHRAALLVTGRDELRETATALAEGAHHPRLLGADAPRPGKLAFLFSGQGSQRLGMGRELYERYPAFADALDTVLAQLDPALRAVMWGTEPQELDRTRFTQPALFAVEVALFRLLESWGVTPDVVAGHSIGEIAAAHAVGVLSLPDACRLVTARARLMDELPPDGAMIAVQADEDEVAPLLTDRVSVAAVNGPASLVLSGEEDAVLRVAARLAGEGRRTSRLRVSHAFHSPLMEPMLDDFRAVLSEVRFQAPDRPVVSNLTGALATGEELCTPEYWVRHARETVRFGDGVRTLAQRDIAAVLELGPDTVLLGMARAALPDEVAAVPTLHRERPEQASVAAALARLRLCGVPVDWRAYFAGGARRVDLPTYAFQHERFWPDTTPTTGRTPEDDGTDRTFWDAVEGEDFASLQATLNVEGDALSQVLPALLDWRRQREEEATVDGWRHRIVWKPLSGAPSGGPTGTWLAVVPSDQADDPWAAAVLDALGTDVVPLPVSGSDQYDRRKLAAQLRDRAGDVTGVLSLLALDETGAETGAPAGMAGTAVLIQALGEAGITAPLWCVTRGAVPVGRSEAVTGPVQAAVWGLGRVAALEYPERWGGVVDLPRDLDERVAAGLAAVLAGWDGEDQVAVRTGAVFGRRLVPAPAQRPGGPGRAERPVRAWEPTGTVLITGGTGALGAHVARRLAHAGAAHLLLAGRRGEQAPGMAALREELLALGSRVTIAACDVADRTALTELLAGIPADLPLTGVVHAAGVLDDGVLDRLTPERFTTVFRAKVTSALLLDELTREADLSVFALFSSASAIVGNPGQANYAAANAVLDALAEQRRSQGLPATSIAWGAWGGGGLAGAAAADEAARRAGVAAMDPARACEALRRLVMEPEPTALVAQIDPERFTRSYGAARPGALLRELPGAQRPVPAGSERADADGALRDRLRKLPPGRRLEAVLDLVRTRCAGVLGYRDADAVGAERLFRDLGVDSLGAVELRNQLVAATGLSLAATLVFDWPTPLALAEHITGRLVPDGADGTTATADGCAESAEEAEIRALLASVPVGRLREIGLLEPLLQLAGRNPEAAAPEDEPEESIDTMALDDLVQAALRRQSDDE